MKQICSIFYIESEYMYIPNYSMLIPFFFLSGKLDNICRLYALFCAEFETGKLFILFFVTESLNVKNRNVNFLPFLLLSSQVCLTTYKEKMFFQYHQWTLDSHQTNTYLAGSFTATMYEKTKDKTMTCQLALNLKNKEFWLQKISACTMRTNLPKTLDLLIFRIYLLNFSIFFLELLKVS